MNDKKYCYPQSNVLINKLSIHNAERLAEAEKKLTMLRLLELQYEPVEGELDFAHLCEIHRYIFQDVYEWAGQLRTVDIAKGNMFCKSEFLRENGEQLFLKLKEENYCENLPLDMFVNRLAYFFSEINALHPFREGNGRAQREFIRVAALNAGYLIDFSRITQEDMIYASKESFFVTTVLCKSCFRSAFLNRGIYISIKCV